MLPVYFLVTALCLVAAKPREQLAITLSSAVYDKVRPIIQKCEDETKSPPNAFSNMLMGKFENDAALNFIYCYLVDLGACKEDGHFNVDKVLSFLKEGHPIDETRKALEECNELNGKDHMDTMRLMADCFRDKSPVYFKPPV